MKKIKHLPLTFLHLLALGAVGPFLLSALLSMLTTGLSGLVIFGLGFIVLVILLYVLFAVSWLERSRVAGLYRLDLASLKFAKPTESTFGGYLRSLWAQVTDPGMWAAFANFTIGVFLGVFTLVWVGGSFVVLPNVPEIFGLHFAFAKPFFVVSGLLVGLLGGFIMAYLFRTISLAVLAGPAREKELQHKAAASEKQRVGAVKAAEVERTRIERDLHDGVQPRLVSIAMTLGLASETVEKNPAGAKKLIDEAHGSTKSAISELRQLVRGIYPSVLEDRGLDAALSAVAARSHIPVQLDVDIKDDCGKDAEAAIYFAIAEALTNAAKHSRAGNCKVTVRATAAQGIWAQVEDNGIGGADFTPGGGLEGIKNRVIAAGGTLTLDSPQGGPTNLEVSVPCA